MGKGHQGWGLTSELVEILMNWNELMALEATASARMAVPP
jgi:hypothetical protein